MAGAAEMDVDLEEFDLETPPPPAPAPEDVQPKLNDLSMGGVELELAPHEPFVSLHQSSHDGQWHLWHGRTREHRVLPDPGEHGEWEMLMQESFGTIWHSITDECLLVDDLLKVGYYYGPDQKGVIIQKMGWAAAESMTHVLSEDTAAMRYSMGSVGALLGPNRTKTKFRVAVKFLPTIARTRLQWSLLSVLEVGGVLQERDGYNSTWMHKRLDRWRARFQKMNFQEQLLLSKPDRKNDAGAAASRERFLPFVSIGTCGLPHLVASWTSPSKQVGGLGCDNSRVAAMSLLGSLLGLLRRASFDLDVFMDSTAVVKDMFVEGCNPVRVRVALGTVSLVPFKAWVEQRPGHRGGSWLQIMGEAGTVPDSVSLTNFIEQLATDMSASNMLMQCCFIVGQRLDSHLFDEVVVSPDEGLEYVGGSGSKHDGDREVCAYWRTSQAFCKAQTGVLDISIALDKSRPNGTGYGNGVMFYSEVVPEHDAEVINSYRSGSAMAAEELLAARRAREEAWVNRGHDADAPKAWRKQPLKRVDSYKWTKMLNHWLLLHAGVGLEAFLQDKPMGERDDPTTWAHLTIAGDQGSDNECGGQFLQRFLLLNIDRVADPSHGVHRDVIKAMKFSGVYKFQLCLRVAWKIPEGPWHKQARHQHAAEAYHELMTTESAATSPLFQSVVKRVLHDIGEDSKHADPGIEERIWEMCKSDNPFRRNRCSTSLNRFCGLLEAGKQEDMDWHRRYLGYAHCCLEADLFKGGGFAKLVLKMGKSAEGDNLGFTNRKADDDKESMFKQCGNQMVVGTLIYADPENQMRERAVLKALRPTHRWHKEQNKELRSLEATPKWMMIQVQCDWRRYLADNFKTLSERATLEWIGFELGACDGDMSGIVARDEEMARILGDTILGVTAARQERMCWLTRGWPARTIELLSRTPAERQKCIDDLKHDWESYNILQGIENPPTALKELLGRSVFALVTVQQFVEAFLRTDPPWTLTDSIVAMTQRRHNKVVSTQVVEDAFKRQTVQAERNPNKRSTPEQNYGVLVRTGVLHSEHSYREITTDFTKVQRAECMHKSCFDPMVHEAKLKLEKIKGTSQKTAWYSPSPTTAHQQYLDLALSSHLVVANDPCEVLDGLWLTCLFRGKHLIIRRKIGQEFTSWFFVLSANSTSAIIVYPALKKVIPNSDGAFFFEAAPAALTRNIMTVIVDDIDNFECFYYEWRSWAWQVSKYPGTQRALPPAVRAVPTATTAVTPLALAAQHAFYDLPRTTVESIASKFGVELAPGDDLCKVLFKTVKGVLQCSPAQAVDILRVRLAVMSATDEACLDDFMELEDAHDYLPQDEARDVAQELKTAKQTKLQFKEFLNAYTAVYKKHRPAEATAASSGDAGSRKKGRGTKRNNNGDSKPALPIPAGALTQMEARQFLPPHGAIWRDLTRGGWCGHMEVGGFTRTSKSWALFGHRGSCLLILRDLWDKYNMLHGNPTGAEGCPHKWLFDDAQLELPDNAGAPGLRAGGTGAACSRDRQ